MPFRRSAWKASPTGTLVMKNYDLSAYGEPIADVYDDSMRTVHPTAAVTALSRLAGEGPVLELGIDPSPLTVGGSRPTW